jgi:glucose 1-dehydrogenase
MRLDGKCALVTGAGVGIGREVAIEFARQGADVALSYHSSAAGAESAVAEIETLGRRACALSADVGRVAECQALVEQAHAYLGRIDILVNNAGWTFTKDFWSTSEEDFDRVYAINIRGQYFCAQAAARYMREQGGGVIINMLSIHALVSQPRHSLYDGTKGAIEAWTRSLALELAPYHIRVVGVAPGAIEVPRFLEKEGYTSRYFGDRIAWGRVGQPTDIAKTCAFLASDEADFIVGAIIVVDGGTTAKMAL